MTLHLFSQRSLYLDVSGSLGGEGQAMGEEERKKLEREVVSVVRNMEERMKEIGKMKEYESREWMEHRDNAVQILMFHTKKVTRWGVLCRK